MITVSTDERHEEGMTLVELLVAMVILVIFFAIFTSVAVKIFDSSTSQQARSDNLDSNRNVVQVLDRQVRYANAINAPASTPGGDRYVTWRSGSKDKQQTCYQWRVTPGGLMQHRSWAQAFGASPAGAVTAWSTVGNGVKAFGSDPIFSISSPIAVASELNRQQLTVSFATVHGTRKPVDTPTKVTLTALNTRTAAAVTVVCSEVLP